ncbi:MAG: sulfite exporter TauE/SafE family protein [Clostridia bacterium]|nr:sulfite exporter TauE/SafE family protein [Clostridia bacterium]
MIDEFLMTLANKANEGGAIVPFIIFLAGILTSLTPCSLSSIPLVIAYVGGMSDNPKKSFKLSLVFALGLTLTFTVLGILAGLFGSMLSFIGSGWYIFIGVLMLFMALQVMEIFEFIPSSYLTSKVTRKGYIGAFFAGVLTGIFSSPCATPILIVLLAFVANTSNFIQSAFLLFLYSVGSSIVIVLIGTFMGFFRSMAKSKQYGVFQSILRYGLGFLMIALGLYMLYLGF